MRQVGKRIVLDDSIVPVFGHTSARVGSRIFVFGGRTAIKPILEYSYPHFTAFDIRAGEASVPIERRHLELGLDK